MTDTETCITDILDSGDEKRFTFDFSIWSHDGYTADDKGYLVPDEGSRYKDQKYVMEKIGT